MQHAHSGKRALHLSLSYVLGMAFTYAIAGMLAAYFGSTVQTLMQQPVIIALFSGLFVLMGFWLLGIFEMRMPSFLKPLQSKSHQCGILSAGVMGSLSTLVVSPLLWLSGCWVVCYPAFGYLFFGRLS
ncbi:MAG: hypothetical protein NTW94_05345 [Legionellales bacterium]|nr:hypothetical protein [Legionellales bacterium]